MKFGMPGAAGNSISLSRLVTLVTAAFFLITLVLIFVVSTYVREKAISDLARDDARKTSELVFQSLYSAMRKGWSKAEITEIIRRLNTAEPDLRVRVFRGEPVIRQFGEIPGESAQRAADPAIATALKQGKDQLLMLASGDLRYIYPVPVRDECRHCHNAAVGDINGVIDIMYPVKNLKVSLDFIINMVIGYFAAVMLLLALSLHSTLRALIVAPVRGMTGVIQSVIANLDLSQRIASPSWITEIRNLIVYFNSLLSTMQRYSSTLEQLSTHDPLTGLYNRRKFDELVGLEVDRCYRSRNPFSLLMVDMDNFKHINDTFGHPVGDLVIKKFARLLNKPLRRTDMIARFGGDEFGILLPETSQEEALEVAEMLRHGIATTEIAMPIGRIKVTASIGLITFPETVADRDKLESAMDVALYKAKKRGRNCVVSIDDNEFAASAAVFARGQAVRKALDEDRIEAHLQPIVAVDTGKIAAYEVLARIRDGDALIIAADFIEQAEELGMAERVDERVFELALATKLELGLHGIPFFFNLSSKTFCNLERMRATPGRLATLGIAATDVVFEITEREALPHISELATLIDELRGQGIRFALDDFGSGFSSFLYLKYLPVDFVKIEGDFVRHAPHDPRDRIMLEHIHAIAHRFGMQTIAEYVEDEAIHRMLAEIGVTYGQGYHYGRPSKRPG